MQFSQYTVLVVQIVPFAAKMEEITFIHSCFSLGRGPSALCLCLTILTKAQGLEGEACVPVKIIIELIIFFPTCDVKFLVGCFYVPFSVIYIMYFNFNEFMHLSDFGRISFG